MLTVNKLDLKGALIERVPLRHTLLEILHPDVAVAIVHVDPDAVQQDRPTVEAALGQDLRGLGLDFASGGKKHGDLFFTDARPRLAERYWATPEEAMAYGGLLVTECDYPPQVMDVPILVVEQGRLGTGDCAGFIHPDLLARFGLPDDVAVQGRVALKDRWVAKFTAVAPQLDSPLETHAATFDRFALVLPDSSFKGVHKSELVDGQAVIEAPLALGIVRATTKPCQAHVGWQAVQWFPWQAIERDVWPHTQAAIERLNAIASDSAEAARFLGTEQLDEDDPLGDLEQERGALVPILQADRANRMIHDPYVVDRLGRILQSTWRRLATSGGVKVPSFMGQPADVLPPNTVVCPELPPGPVIVFRYPIRTWADVQLWRNVGSEVMARQTLGEGGQALVRWARHYRGCVWMSHETAARLGGDFDGDFYQVAPAARFPIIAACIRRFNHRPEYHVPDIPKVKTRHASPWADLPRVALDQVDNAVGLIAWAIAKVWAIGRDPGRLQTVKRLADELQIAVDKFKYSLVQDEAYVAAVCEAIKKAEEQRGRVTWLDCRKDHHVFRRETPQAEAGDALSRLWNRVHDAWQGWTLEAWPLEHQRHLLPQAYTQAQYQEARRVVCWYNRRIAQAMRLPDQACSEAIQRTIALLEERAAQKPDKAAWASALWHAAIDQARPTSTASVRFHGFLDEVCQALASIQVQEWPETIRVVGLRHNDWASGLQDLGARPRTVTLAEGPMGDQWRVWAVVEGARLGVIPQDAAIVGRTPLAIPVTFSVSPTGTYADMHVVTA
jgi:hypothetical protein